MSKFQRAVQDAVKDPAAETRVDLSLDVNLAPPPVGRAVTMPGVMRKAVWAGGPTHFRELFKLASAA